MPDPEKIGELKNYWRKKEEHAEVYPGMIRAEAIEFIKRPYTDCPVPPIDLIESLQNELEQGLNYLKTTDQLFKTLNPNVFDTLLAKDIAAEEKLLGLFKGQEGQTMAMTTIGDNASNGQNADKSSDL